MPAFIGLNELYPSSGWGGMASGERSRFSLRKRLTEKVECWALGEEVLGMAPPAGILMA